MRFLKKISHYTKGTLDSNTRSTITKSMDQNIEHAEDFPLSGIKLLLADDEVRLRQIVVLMAVELGARVIAVDSCEEAIEIYKNKQSEIDIIMLDLRMNGIGGEAAFKELIKFDSNARIVLSSGMRPDESLFEELDKHNCLFIEKPFDMDQLSAALS